MVRNCLFNIFILVFRISDLTRLLFIKVLSYYFSFSDIKFSENVLLLLLKSYTSLFVHVNHAFIHYPKIIIIDVGRINIFLSQETHILTLISFSKLAMKSSKRRLPVTKSSSCSTDSLSLR